MDGEYRLRLHPSVPGLNSSDRGYSAEELVEEWEVVEVLPMQNVPKFRNRQLSRKRILVIAQQCNTVGVSAVERSIDATWPFVPPVMAGDGSPR